MADLPRLNGVIRALESGKPAFTSFCQADPETAIAMATAKYDGVVFEMEHNPWDIRALRDSLQYMLNRAQIVKAASPAPGVLVVRTLDVRARLDGADSTEWIREGAVSRQAGAGPLCLRHRLAAHLFHRGSLQCGGCVPIPAPEDRPGL